MLRSLTLISLIFACTIATSTFYNTFVTVANVFYAGTDSWIYLRYHGENGPSEWRHLNLRGVNDLEKGKTYHYTHTLDKDVGQVNSYYRGNTIKKLSRTDIILYRIVVLFTVADPLSIYIFINWCELQTYLPIGYN